MAGKLRLATYFCIILAALALGACSGGGDGERKVTGTVEDVQAAAIDTFSSLTVRDSSGRLWTFGEGRFPAFTPSHLLEHQALGEPVTVTYVEEEDGTLRPLAIEDAPLQTSPSAR